MKNANAILRLAVVCGLLILGVAALHYSPYLFGAEVDKIPTPLTQDLVKMAMDVGATPKFCALGHDEIMTPDVLDRLGTKLYLLREYTQVTSDGKPTPDVVDLNINYYEKGTATPHVPDICWAGNGMLKIVDELIVVHDVPHKDGSKGDVPMRLLSFMPARQPGADNSTAEEQPNNDRLLTVGYTFQVNGQYVGNTAQVAKLFWRRGSKYCYHCKIEITYDHMHPCARSKARPVIEEFLRASLPSIEECLPDWQKLNAPPGARGASAKVVASY